MAYSGGNPNGLTTSANSAPVVIASDNVVDTASNQVITTGSITAADAASATTTGQSSQSIITGTPTANSAYAFAIPNVNGTPESFSSAVIHITGTFVATYQFERSPDGGTTWTPFSPFVAGQPQANPTGTSPGMFHGNIAGVTNIRVRATAFTSGTIGVRFSLGVGVGTVTVGNPIRLYDMANNAQASIKPSSTAPIATDTSIVTTEHPNSPLLTGTMKVKLANDLANVTGTITTSTSTVATGALSGVGSATVSITGTYAGVNVTFEGSIDNTNWVTVPAQPIGSVTPTPIITTGVLTSNSTNLWNITPLLGVQYVRVRATAYTSGTANVVIVPSAQFTQPIVNIGSGTITTTSNDAVTTGSLAAANATATTAILTGASTAAIQVSGTFVGTITPSMSLDGTNYINLSGTGLMNVNSGAYGATIGSAGIYQLDVAGINYFRLTMTSYTSGTATITVKASAASGNVALDAPLPPGAATIGSISNINTSVTPGTGSVNLGKAQGSTPGTTDTGVATLAVRAPATPTARTGTAGNYELLLADQEGKLIDQPYADPANGWYATLIMNNATSITAVRAAGATGIRNFVTTATISNSSATGTLASIVDGTGSTIMWQSWIAGGASVNITFSVPLRGTAATQVSASSSVSVSALYVSLTGYLGV